MSKEGFVASPKPRGFLIPRPTRGPSDPTTSSSHDLCESSQGNVLCHWMRGRNIGQIHQKRLCLANEHIMFPLHQLLLLHSPVSGAVSVNNVLTLSCPALSWNFLNSNNKEQKRDTKWSSWWKEDFWVFFQIWTGEGIVLIQNRLVPEGFFPLMSPGLRERPSWGHSTCGGSPRWQTLEKPSQLLLLFPFQVFLNTVFLFHMPFPVLQALI